MLTFYFIDKPLGASTASARAVGLVGRLCGRRHTDSLHYYTQKKMPKIDWEVMLVGGIVLGALLGAWAGGDVTGRWLPRGGSRASTRASGYGRDWPFSAAA